jgi:hypothetical protein
MQEDFTFRHGIICRQPLPPSPTRIVSMYCVADTSHVMLLIRKDWSTRTEYFDMAVIRSWMVEHHRELCVEVEGGTLDVDLAALPADVLDPCFQHARAEWRKQNPTPFDTFELGTLVDANHAFLNYAKSMS